MKHAWLGLVIGLGACAAPKPPPAAPRVLDEVQLVVESPTPDLLVHQPELDVQGRFHTEDGKAWVWVDATQATIEGQRFVAHHVPLREGKTELKVELTDGRGRKRSVVVPLVVETHDRPRSDKVCVPGGCVRYETRGQPRRDERGQVTNAVVVVSAFGFDEKLDELWPDLVGPGRALDSRRYFIVGVAPPETVAGGAPDTAEMLVARALFSKLSLSPRTPLIGASSYGAELVLRLMAHDSTLVGPILVCGGHDRPYEEPAMRRVYEIATRAHGTPDSQWLAIAEAMVPASYTPAYLAKPAHAMEHGLVAETASSNLTQALVTSQAAYFRGKLTVETLADRMKSAMELEHARLDFARPIEGSRANAGRTVILVANKLDHMMSFSRVQALAARLQAAGAHVELHAFDDELGHSAFFRHVPEELERGVAALLADRP